MVCGLVIWSVTSLSLQKSKYWGLCTYPIYYSALYVEHALVFFHYSVLGINKGKNTQQDVLGYMCCTEKCAAHSFLVWNFSKTIFLQF